MGKLLLKIFFLIGLILLFVSWHIKIIFLFILFMVLRKYISTYNENKMKINLSVFILFLIAFWFVFPNRTSYSSDYIQSVHFDINTGDKIKEPILPYLFNIVGEGDIMAFVSLGSYFIPENIFKGKAIGDVINYNKSTYFVNNNFHSSYRKLEPLKTPSHHVPFQIMKDLGYHKDVSHYFLHVPNAENLQNYEVVVFCHGFAGSWLLYSELFAKYTNAIIIAVETPGFNGYFSKKIMNNIISRTLPHAYNQIGINYKKPHLVGLSNGGSAINSSIVYYPNEFKSFTILSASLKNNPRTNKKVNVIYGSNDRSGGINKKVPNSKFIRHLIEGEDHSLLVAQPEITFKLINQIINQ
ncbi:alpha/beta hydrolase [Psychroflexus sp. CAK57W]|uniref:alpha/beta hydrolase n=1 Tax=Psychroflexus curvus TaxID=2873595 RepID=UPI001CCBC7AD|nr:alpha/beta hydrolase [Psychroflexus curvus]MBZ9787595.1 alpha/beta hydrolase [Psychroflexus curvus]